MKIKRLVLSTIIVLISMVVTLAIARQSLARIPEQELAGSSSKVDNLASLPELRGVTSPAPVTHTDKRGASDPEPLDPEGIQRLIDDTNGAARVSVSPATGAARFVRFPAGSLSLPTRQSPSLEDQAAAFFNTYGSIFGISDASAELRLEQAEKDKIAGTTRLKYQQVYRGVPVFAGILHVHFDANDRLTAVNGAFIPNVSLNPAPSLSEKATSDVAVARVGAQLNLPLGAVSTNIGARKSTLYVFRAGLAQGVAGLNYLVREVEVGNGFDVREFVYVDAHTGKVVDQISGIHEALTRRVYDGGYDPIFIEWEEGDPIPYVGSTPTQTLDINNLISGTGESYNLFFNAFGRDSYDNGIISGTGALMETVNNDPNINCPNANWNGTSTNYCTGVTGDDTVAHEWGHAYTEYTHNLIYAWQPGALNEAYSDIWGEVVDFINGRGTDSPLGLRSANTCSIYTPPSPEVRVNSPAGIAGSYPAGPAQFGPPLTGAGITGTVVLANDGVGTGVPPSPAPTDACEPLTNGAAISGNIALVDRGTCAFTVKVKNAQNAGAIGVIVANHVVGGDGLTTMAGTDPTITIPSVFIGYSNGNLIKSQLGTGVNATLRLGVPGVTENSYRWLSGEDDPAFGGAIRDMWNPTCYYDPGKVSDTLYQCSTSDNGGVHTNSGVPNHAFALLVDGGTYNGQVISSIGLTKTAHLYWRAQDVYQGPASDFADHADALQASCTDLLNVNLNNLTNGLPSGAIITTTDCVQVTKVISATELRTPPTQCNFQPLLAQNPPPLCSASAGALTPVFTDTFEITSTTAWTVSNTGVYTGYVPIDWVFDSTLPKGRPGTAFYANNVIDNDGNCSQDVGDVSRVMYLTSPVITLPATINVPRLAFDHYVATETGFDGGNLKVSVNGGPYQLVDPADYTFNPYNAVVAATNPLDGEPAFTGTDGGEVTGSWGQSQVDLRNYAEAGDAVRLRFEFGADGCTGVDGWYVDDVRAYYCANDPLQKYFLPITLKFAAP